MLKKMVCSWLGSKGEKKKKRKLRNKENMFTNNVRKTETVWCKRITLATKVAIYYCKSLPASSLSNCDSAIKKGNRYKSQGS